MNIFKRWKIDRKSLLTYTLQYIYVCLDSDSYRGFFSIRIFHFYNNMYATAGTTVVSGTHCCVYYVPAYKIKIVTPVCLFCTSRNVPDINFNVDSRQNHSQTRQRRCTRFFFFLCTLRVCQQLTRRETRIIIIIIKKTITKNEKRCFIITRTFCAVIEKNNKNAFAWSHSAQSV